MPNATVRATARTLSEATNRRAVMGALVAAGGAVTLAPAATAAGLYSGDELVSRLWEKATCFSAPGNRGGDSVRRSGGAPPRMGAERADMAL